MSGLPSPADFASALHSWTSGPWQLGVAVALATLVSEDLACVAAGLLASRGDLSLVAAIVAALLGIAGGDILLYLAGRGLGAAVLARRPLRNWIRPQSLQRARETLHRWGGPALLGARFVPGLRLPTYVLSGVVRMPLLPFSLWIVLGAALWTPILVSASAGAGTWFSSLHVSGAALWLAGATMLALLWLLHAWVLPLFTWRGRRLLLGRWRRLTRWEFWPIWLFNAPVVAHFAWLALRHRSLSVFTAANPAIPSGGLVRESKAGILEGLAAGDAAGAVARFRRVPAAQDSGGDATGAVASAGGIDGSRVAIVREFLAAHGQDFPVVLKPDIGQRGEGVRILRHQDMLAPALAAQTSAAIVQEYVAGVEFGLFYVRDPREDAGRLFSITRKRLPAIVGDGLSTLERLILADERAVCMAPLHLDRHAERLDSVPAHGERVDLVELGNHCRGAVFLDGGDLETPELATAVDRLARGYDGFYFGRFDVRSASEEELRAGRFRVLELNGVASEATHIYDPSMPLHRAYRVLFEQWRLCFAIGAANAAAGHAPTPLRELLREILTFLRPSGSAAATAEPKTRTQSG